MSLWIQTAFPYKPFPTLEQSIQCDVCIIGGGLSGIANAYFLAQEGKHVVVIEKDAILQGATGNSTGKLTVQHGPIYTSLIQKFGVEAAKTYYEANAEAVQFGRSIATDEILATANSVLYAQTDEGVNILKDEYNAYDTLKIPGLYGYNSEVPLKIRSTLTIENECQIHPVRFGQTIAELAVQAGAQIYEQSTIETIRLKDQQLQLTNGASVQFQDIIFSSHYPIESLTGAQILKLAVNRSYLVAAETDMPLMNQYIAVDQPKQTMRTVQIDRKHYFLLGGDDHPAGFIEHTEVYYEQLYEALKKDFLLTSLVTGWSAQDPETPDIIPYAGQITKQLPHVYISTGNGKWGLSTALAGARVITDQIVGRHNEAIALYSPSRTKFGALLLQSFKLAGRAAKEFTIGHVTRTSAPICTHLGCRTRWNVADETWDCPCHGSRFRKDGSVLEGPATKPLDL